MKHIKATLIKTAVEKYASLEDFYVANNIDEDELYYLGKGDFGVAYSIGDGRVLKKTTSVNEFNIAQKLQSSHIDVFAKVYATAVVDNDKYIILEELETDSVIEDKFYEVLSILEPQGLSVQYIEYLDEDEVDGGISPEMQKFIDALCSIVSGYRRLGIEASDIRPENLGYGSKGVLKAFDIDDKAR